jgi:hypothetical protein
MSSAIARAASQAYARRDQERPRFASERILVRSAETAFVKDDRGVVLTVQLRPTGRVKFATAHSWGSHRETLDAIVSGKIEQRQETGVEVERKGNDHVRVQKYEQ